MCLGVLCVCVCFRVLPSAGRIDPAWIDHRRTRLSAVDNGSRVRFYSRLPKTGLTTPIELDGMIICLSDPSPRCFSRFSLSECCWTLAVAIRKLFHFPPFLFS
uniref:Putative secreted protein n=1 Tax=Anopheles marajoara TaxID=58244 RepID=A0A2M4C8J3_9DIPT